MKKLLLGALLSICLVPTASAVYGLGWVSTAYGWTKDHTPGVPAWVAVPEYMTKEVDDARKAFLVNATMALLCPEVEKFGVRTCAVATLAGKAYFDRTDWRGLDKATAKEWGRVASRTFAVTVGSAAGVKTGIYARGLLGKVFGAKKARCCKSTVLCGCEEAKAA